MSPAEEVVSAVTRRETVSKTSRWPIVIFAVVALLAVGWVAMFTVEPATQGVADIPVRRMPVQSERVQEVTSIEQVRTYTGDVRARQQSDLGFELSGRIEQVMVDEGDFAEAGQPLATLDTRAWMPGEKRPLRL